MLVVAVVIDFGWFVGGLLVVVAVVVGAKCSAVVGQVVVAVVGKKLL